MGIRLSALYSALVHPKDHFRRLWRYLILDDAPCIIIDAENDFAEVTFTTPEYGRAMMFIPIARHTLSVSKLLATPQSSLLSPYILFERELEIEGCLVDVVVQYIPSGNPLSVTPLRTEAALRMIDELECECRRVGFSHNCLTAENIIVGSDSRLYPIRYHRATMDGAMDNFDALRAMFVGESQLLCDVEQGYATDTCELFDMRNGYIRFKQNNRYGYMNYRAERVVEAKYLWADDFCEQRAIVLGEEGYGVIDTKGREVFPPYLEELYYDTYNTLFYYFEDGEACAFDYNGTPLEQADPRLATIDTSRRFVNAVDAHQHYLLSKKMKK